MRLMWTWLRRLVLGTRRNQCLQRVSYLLNPRQRLRRRLGWRELSQLRRPTPYRRRRRSPLGPRGRSSLQRSAKFPRLSTRISYLPPCPLQRRPHPDARRGLTRVVKNTANRNDVLARSGETAHHPDQQECGIISACLRRTKSFLCCWATPRCVVASISPLAFRRCGVRRSA